MLRWTLTLTVVLLAPPCLAEDDTAPQVSPATPAMAPKIVAVAPTVPAESTAGAAPARFESAARWALAGYNNNEVIYTILVTSHDDRIIRCTTELTGSFFEDGKKQTIADRQVTTVFPDQEAQVGNWMGLDEKSGTTYSVQCKAL